MSSIKKNYLYTVCYQILNIGLPLLTTPYISRVLGAKNVGIYAYSYAVVQYFILFSMLGISDHGNRTIAGSRENKKEMYENFWSIYLVQFSATVLSIIIFIILIKYSEPSNKIVLLCTGIYLIAVLFDINWFFWGIENFRLTVIRSTFIKIVSVVLIFMFVKSEKNLIEYILIMSLANLLSNVLLWYFMKEAIAFFGIYIKKTIMQIKPCLILFIPLAARSVFVYMDKIMLGQLSTMEQTGFYEYSEKIILAPTSILTSLGTVMLPRISNMKINESNDKIENLIMKSMEFIIVLGVAFSFGIAAIADDFAPLFLGREYEKCGKIIAMMSITIILVGWTNVIRTQYLIPNHKDKIYVIAVVLGAVANFAVNYLLIPNYGAMGAVIGWITAEIIITFCETLGAVGKLPIKQYLKILFKVMCIGSVMFIAVIYIKQCLKRTILNLIIEIFVGIIIYVGCIGGLLLYSNYRKNSHLRNS